MTNTSNYAASNSDVRKRYTLSQIMTRAWQVTRNQGIAFIPTFKSFSEALKWTWGEFRDILTKQRAASYDRARKLAKQVMLDADKPVTVPFYGPRSPLNPASKSRFPNWGVKGNAETSISAFSR